MNSASAETRPAGSAESQERGDTPEARRYNRLRRRISVADFLTGLGFLLVLLVAGWTYGMRDWADSAARGHYALAVFFYVAVLLSFSKFLTAPLDYYGFRLEHRYGLSRLTLRAWLADELKSWIISLLLACVVVELVYGAIRLFPQRWWVIAWAVFAGLSVFFAQLAPVLLFPLFYKFEPLKDEELKQRLLKLSQRAGTRVRGVYEWKLSAKSKKANAALAGLGPTRRILISDTLLASYSPDEIEAVLAHELGHHVHRHVPKGIAVHVLVTFLGFWAAPAVLRYAVKAGMFSSLSDFANLPLLALVSTVLSFIVMPVLNAYSRHNERQADLYCFQSIASVAPFISSMDKLAAQNLAERNPSRLVETFFHSHPAVSRRIEAARAYAERH